MKKLAKRQEFGFLSFINTESYTKEVNQNLSDKASYQQLTEDKTLWHNKMVNQTTERFKNKKLFP